MQIAILLYDNFMALDAVGPFDVLRGLPDSDVVLVAERTGPVRTEAGLLAITADATLTDVPTPDIIVVPGGGGAEADQLADGPAHEWLRAADTTSTWTTSVCTGSLILAAAGLLTGKKATSHWTTLDKLEELGATAVEERVVFDGKYVTAGGVSAGIDMALTLVDRIAGAELAQRIQLVLEYDPQPPYDVGSPSKAPRELVDKIRTGSR